jgi:protein TonB
MFCSKIFNADAEKPATDGPPQLYALASSDNPSLTTIMWEQDRKSFAYQPEMLYHNKEVCIRGVVQLYQGKPRIIIRNREQLTVKTPIRLEEAGMYAGDSITVLGKVVRSQYFSDVASAPTILFMGAENPEQLLTAVIENADRKKFIANPEINYLNKEISVFGKVILVNNKPQIILRQRDQVEETLKGSMASLGNAGGQSVNTVAAVTQTNNVANRMAAFPGGAQAWNTFFRENLKVPKRLLTGDKKTVMVRFKISEDGSITGHEIVESAGKGYDEEALRVLKLMPKWLPEIQNGQPVSVSFKLPITFERVEDIGQQEQ